MNSQNKQITAASHHQSPKVDHKNMRWYNLRPASKGFTILELLIVITISSILLMLAVPSYQDFIKRNNVESLQARLSAAIVTARSEATSRNSAVTLCSSADGEACGGTWSDGWIVFLDNGEGGGTLLNATRETGEQIILRFNNNGNYSVSLKDEVTDSALSSFSFNSRGFSLNDKRALVTVCEPSGVATFSRGLIIERSGRSMKTQDLSGDDGIHESRFDNGFGSVTVKNLSCQAS